MTIEQISTNKQTNNDKKKLDRKQTYKQTNNREVKNK